MYGQLDLPGEWVLLLQLFAALNTGRFGPLALHHALISEVIRCGQFLSKHIETLAVADEKPNQQNVTKVQVTLKIIPVRCFIEANQQLLQGSTREQFLPVQILPMCVGQRSEFWT